MIYHSGNIYIFWEEHRATKKSEEVFSIWLQSNMKYKFTYDDIKVGNNWFDEIDICENNKLLLLKYLEIWISDVREKWNTNFI